MNELKSDTMINTQFIDFYTSGLLEFYVYV